MDAVGPPMQLSPDTLANSADLLVFLVVGLFASAHCLGMGDPLVSIYADRVVELDAAVPVGDIVRGATGILIGLCILTGGVSYLFHGMQAPVPERVSGVSSLFNRVSGHLTSRIDRLTDPLGIVGPGTVHAVLPCPIIYPAHLYAFALGDTIRGGLALGVLGLGTMPTLLASETMLGTLFTKRRVSLHRGPGAAFPLLGYILQSNGLMLPGFDVPHLNVLYYQPLT